MRKQLSPPLCCDNCKSLDIKFCLNSTIYGIERGEWPYCYHCKNCDAMVGCHPNTANPMGRMATASTRRKRARLHELFDIVWQERYLTRDNAYKWLAKELNLSETEDCHIGQLSNEDLEKAILIMRVHKTNEYVLFKRRKVKNESRKFAELSRRDSKIGRRKYG